MFFPHSREVFSGALLRYVSLERLLTAAKDSREWRLDGCLAFHYGGEWEYLFLRRGEPVGAARARGLERRPLPIEDVIDRARRKERGSLSYWDTGEDLLTALLILHRVSPRWRAVSSRYLRFKELIQQLHARRFEGLLEISRHGRLNVLLSQEGRPRGGFFLENFEQPGTKLLANIRSALEREAYLLSLYAQVPGGLDSLVQANPAQVHLLRTVLATYIGGLAGQLPAAALEEQFARLTAKIRQGTDLRLSVTEVRLRSILPVAVLVRLVVGVLFGLAAWAEKTLGMRAWELLADATHGRELQLKSLQYYEYLERLRSAARPPAKERG